MKKLLYFWLLAVAMPTHAQEKQPKPSVKVLDEKFGFRDVKLESLISEHPEMQELAAEGGATPKQRLYKRPSDDLKIGGAQVKSIAYSYYEGRLSSVMISADGVVNSTPLLEALQAQYGHGYHPSSSDYYPYRWEGKLAELFFKVDTSGDASMLLFSVALRKQEEKDDKVKAKAAKSDL